MWSGASNAIPDGWALCNGSNGTPDLRDRFIVGAGNEYVVGATGGEATHVLTINEIPSHNHTFTGTAHNHSGSVSLSGLTCSEAGDHVHTMVGRISTTNNKYNPAPANAAANTASLEYTTNSAGSHTHTISGSGTVTVDSATAGGTISNSGSGSAHENRPPYYALCFIMKL